MPAKDAEAVLEDFDVAERARLRAGRTLQDVMLGDFEPW